jgi:hypothetical protein
MLPSEASVLVTVVPMLAPMIIGTASGSVRVPAPTSPTIVAVDTDEDWTSTVARIPANKPEIGLATFSRSPFAGTPRRARRCRPRAAPRRPGRRRAGRPPARRAAPVGVQGVPGKGAGREVTAEPRGAGGGSVRGSVRSARGGRSAGSGGSVGRSDSGATVQPSSVRRLSSRRVGGHPRSAPSCRRTRLDRESAAADTSRARLGRALDR